MKHLVASKMVDGFLVDHFNGERSEALDVAFRAVARDLLEKRRGTGGRFRIVLEWTPDPKKGDKDT